jgi:opacity protein-like surface antigen
MLCIRSCSHLATGRRGAGSTRWPILAPVSAVALMTGAPSAAYAQCIGSLNAAAAVIGTVNTAFLPSGSAFLSSAPNIAPDQQGGGVWTRAVGGTVETKADSNFSASLAVTPPAGASFPLSFTTNCRASLKQDFAGFEAGHDIAVLNSGNAEWHFGALAGYVGAKVETPSAGPGAVGQSGTVDAPSAGLYAAFYKGPFSADVQTRLYNLEMNSAGQRFDSRGYSLAGNMSYRFDLPGNWTLEPSVGGIFSHTSVDQFSGGDLNNSIGVPVTALSVVGISSIAASGVLQVHEVESFLGRASVKVGTSLPLAGGQIVAYPFVTASVFHEFEGTATASLALSGTFLTSGGPYQFQGGGNLTTSGIGTYAQIGAGSAVQLVDIGWVGFARVDYRTGENVQGVSGSVGLRYEFDDPGHVAENRARYPVKASMTAGPAGGYDWTGPYAGFSAGSTRGGTHWAYQGANADPDYAGVLAGGQAGYIFQTGRFVWGLEGDAGASNARGGKACPTQPVLFGCEDDVRALGSLTGRFGYTWGRALFYAKGGWAFGEVTAGTSLGTPPAPAGMNAAKSTNWESGWTVGAGMEYALTDRWSAKAEYMHYEFPQYAFAVGQGATANATTAGDTVRIGVNYHFRP